jgi:hypothetical protein
LIRTAIRSVIRVEWGENGHVVTELAKLAGEPENLALHSARNAQAVRTKNGDA